MNNADKCWRLWNGRRTKVDLQWEPRDMWVGLFWRRTDCCLHLYVCVVPLLPIHVTIWMPDRTVVQ